MCNTYAKAQNEKVIKKRRSATVTLSVRSLQADVKIRKIMLSKKFLWNHKNYRNYNKTAKNQKLPRKAKFREKQISEKSKKPETNQDQGFHKNNLILWNVRQWVIAPEINFSWIVATMALKKLISEFSKNYFKQMFSNPSVFPKKRTPYHRLKVIRI